MTRPEHAERTRQLCNLVNVRRIQLGKEPYPLAHIARAVRKVIGAEPAILYPERYPKRKGHLAPVPYAMTGEAQSHWLQHHSWPMEPEVVKWPNVKG